MPDFLLANEPTIRLSAFLGILVARAAWEVAAPRRRREIPRILRWTNNLGVVVADTILVRLTFPVAAVGLALFAEEHGLKIINIADLIGYRLRTERFVRRVATPRLPTRFGEFTLYAYENELDNKTHIALVMGEVEGDEPVLVRVHSECLTGDAFFSQRCDCGPQLETAMQRIGEEGRGVIVYLRQEGRGIGLVHKLRAYELQDEGADTVEANEALGFKADQRDYGIGAQILTDLGISKLRIMTNNPRKFVGLSGYGLEIVERLPIEIPATETTRRYLETKKNKLGHDLSSV